MQLMNSSASGSFTTSQENLMKLGSSASLSSTTLIEPPGKLVEDEKRESGRVAWSIYWLYLTRAFGFYFIVLIFVVQIITQSFAISADFWLSHETSQTSFSAIVFMRVYALLCAGSWLSVVVRAILMALFSLETTQKFYLDMLKSIFRAPMSFFDTTPAGRILTRVRHFSQQTVNEIINALV